MNLPAATANVDNYDAAPGLGRARTGLRREEGKREDDLHHPGRDGCANAAVGRPRWYGGIAQAAATVGVKTLSCSNNGSDAAWTACFKQAMAKKVSAIVIAGGLPPAAVASLVTTATAAGIKVIAAHVPESG